MSGDFFLQAGDFNARLEVQSSVDIDDGCGGTTGSWQLAFEVWAKIVPVKGVLITEADSQRATQTHWIYIRKNSAISSKNRFQNGQRVFEIQTIIDPDESGRFMKCYVREIE